MKLNQFIKVIIIAWLCTSSHNLAGQVTTIQDSIEIAQITKAIKDTLTNNPEIALKMSKGLLDKSITIKSVRAQSIAHNLLGNSYQKLGDLPNAIAQFNQSIAISRAQHYETELSATLGNIGGAYIQTANYEQAITAIQESLTIRIQLKDSAGIARCNKLLAECMTFQNNLPQASNYIQKAIAIYKRLGDQRKISNSLNSYSVILIEQKQYDKALGVLKEVNSIATELKSEDLYSSIYLNIGLCYDYLNKKDSAKVYYTIALKMASQYNDLENEMIALNNLGEIILLEKNYATAEKYFLESLAKAKQLGSIEDIRIAQQNLATLYEEMGNIAKALAYQKDYAATTDSLRSEQKMKTIEEMTIKFDTKQVDERNVYLQSENTIVKLKNKQKNYAIFLMLAFAVALASWVYAYVKRKQALNAAKQEALQQKLLLSQMNPHFIFNSIDNIQSLIYKNKNEEAVHYLNHFSKLTRQILENSSENYITLNEEVEMLDNYINIQKLLYGLDFNYEIKTDNLDLASILVPPMLAQPFVENAIKHGLKNKNSLGVLNIAFYKKDEKLFFEIIDNGLGLQKSNQEHQHKSIATSIVKERLKDKANSIIVTNRMNENGEVIGVSSSFEMPYIIDN